MKDYAIIYNPTSAAGKSKPDFELAISTLEELGVDFELDHTEYGGHATDLAEELSKEGHRIIGAGGDGTCNEVLNGAIKSGRNPLVGFIPMGSGNDIPGAVGYKPDVKRACEIIAKGHTGRNDVGWAKTPSIDSKRYFLGIGSQGFDAEVTKVTNEEEKSLNGTLNYVKNVLKLVFFFKKRKVRITMDDGTFERRCNLIAVANGPSYGGGMYICPYARVNDEKFHITVVDMGRFQLLYNFNKMYSKTLHPHPKAMEYVSEKVEIEMLPESENEDPYIAQVDGEIIGELPITYGFLKGGYEFIKPEKNEMELYFKENYGKKYEKHCQKHHITKNTIVTQEFKCE